jgi:hypothetical protein
LSRFVIKVPCANLLILPKTILQVKRRCSGIECAGIFSGRKNHDVIESPQTDGRMVAYGFEFRMKLITLYELADPDILPELRTAQAMDPGPQSSASGEDIAAF